MTGFGGNSNIGGGGVSGGGGGGGNNGGYGTVVKGPTSEYPLMVRVRTPAQQFLFY
jgi:hypothetical protein